MHCVAAATLDSTRTLLGRQGPRALCAPAGGAPHARRRSEEGGGGEGGGGGGGGGGCRAATGGAGAAAGSRLAEGASSTGRLEDARTIFALSSGAGRAGIAVLRVSGPSASAAQVS